MRLLVVEDEPRIASFLIKGLKSRGYEVEHASTGTDALELAAKCDLVLLDLGLPDLDGLDVLREVRTRGLTIPVIILTARSGDREAGMRLGAADFLVKPLPFARLLESVNAALRPTIGASLRQTL
jgi:two-component system, OmpR family, copper resistance phosphate regulon response regulator CusR